MEVFAELGSKDPHFTYHVQADKEGRINALMWANGDSRLVQKRLELILKFSVSNTEFGVYR